MIQHIYDDWFNNTSDSWHNVRETSAEIAAAIYELSAQKGIDPNAIWSEPTDVEKEAVEERAFSILSKTQGEQTLWWGYEEIINHRPCHSHSS